jgi:hypothetical protein
MSTVVEHSPEEIEALRMRALKLASAMADRLDGIVGRIERAEARVGVLSTYHMLHRAQDDVSHVSERLRDIAGMIHDGVGFGVPNAKLFAPFIERIYAVADDLAAVVQQVREPHNKADLQAALAMLRQVPGVSEFDA